MSRLVFSAEAVRTAADDAWAKSGMSPLDVQREIVVAALSEPIVRVRAAPGYGASVVAGIVRSAWATLAADAGGDRQTLVLAGTGKSARINSMVVGDVQTVHASLEYDAASWTWRRTQARPLEAGMIVLVDSYGLDEAVLIALVKASCNAHLLMIEDSGSNVPLPPFGRLIEMNEIVRQPERLRSI